MLSVLHGKLGDGKMVVPVSSHVYKVNIVAFAKFFIALWTKVDIGGLLMWWIQ